MQLRDPATLALRPVLLEKVDRAATARCKAIAPGNKQKNLEDGGIC